MDIQEYVSDFKQYIGVLKNYYNQLLAISNSIERGKLGAYAPEIIIELTTQNRRVQKCLSDFDRGIEELEASQNQLLAISDYIKKVELGRYYLKLLMQFIMQLITQVTEKIMTLQKCLSDFDRYLEDLETAYNQLLVVSNSIERGELGGYEADSKLRQLKQKIVVLMDDISNNDVYDIDAINAINTYICTKINETYKKIYGKIKNE